ncbi:hypothetical protein GPECTOR_12g455 [Gonium pectorale]|uniref:Guanylate cyclase domain-containing protein n=1 Tax=Gonium pectorale TaxID=33097 RepID=A0A150GP25_GONPE|nr:hypothetical protein GPECTOR_12g455 [Gonium pectorale]|eukprot:KXZ51492.1 hypothetical protein GPECTOR_12g455 [Gonium pectorale]
MVDYVSDCLKLQVQPARALRIMVPNTGIVPILQRHADEYSALTGVRVVLNQVSFFEIGAEVQQELRSNLSDFSDGWIIDPAVTAHCGHGTSLVHSQVRWRRVNGFKSLDEYIPEDPSLQWSDFSRFFRQVSAIYDGKVVSIPLDGDLMLMYYRRDLFDAHNLTVPATWEDFVSLAQRMNGTDTDGDGYGDLYGVCFDNGPPVCKANFLLICMAAPYLQYLGTSQGLFADPETMQPLADSAGMLRAIDHYVRLWEVQPKTPSCGASNVDFREGRCLMTVNWGDEFKAQALTRGSNWTRKGWRLGVAPLPGSHEVYDRRAGALVPCASTVVCPHAREMALGNGSRALVNFAPFSAFGGWAGSVSSIAPPAYQRRAYEFFAYVARPNNSWADVLDPSTGIDPYRLSQLDTSGPTFGRWVAAGYDAEATRAYLEAIRAALESDNVVLDSRIEFVGMSYRLVYEFMLHNLTWTPSPGLTIEAAARSVQRSLSTAFTLLGPTDELRARYCKLIGCVYNGASAAAEDSGKRAHTRVVIAASVGASVGSLAVALALLALLWRRSTRHRHLLLGAVKAPGHGPGTTLMVTDIESSTTLWELLPEEAMGRAVDLHHAVVRSALYRCSGYESATEGDSFICAFHSAADAVKCAMLVQQELLTANWPAELLACTDCPAVAEVALAPGGRSADALALMLGIETRASFTAAATGAAGAKGRSRWHDWLLQQLLPAGLRPQAKAAEQLSYAGAAAAAASPSQGDAPAKPTSTTTLELSAAAAAAAGGAATIAAAARGSSNLGVPAPGTPSKSLSPRESYNPYGQLPSGIELHSAAVTEGIYLQEVSAALADAEPCSTDPLPPPSSSLPSSAAAAGSTAAFAASASAPPPAAGSAIGAPSGRAPDVKPLTADGASAASVLPSYGSSSAQLAHGVISASLPVLEGGSQAARVIAGPATAAATGPRSAADLCSGAAAAATRPRSAADLCSGAAAAAPGPRSAADLRSGAAAAAATGPRSAADLRSDAAAAAGGRPGSPFGRLHFASSGAAGGAAAAAAAAHATGSLPTASSHLPPGQEPAETTRLTLMDCMRAAWTTTGAAATAAAAAGLQSSQLPSLWRHTASQLSLTASPPSITSVTRGTANLARALTPRMLRESLTSEFRAAADSSVAGGSAAAAARRGGGGGGAAALLYRGLRVRIGIATGVPEPSDVSYVPGEARMHYSGAGMRLARAMSSAAAGGQASAVPGCAGWEGSAGWKGWEGGATWSWPRGGGRE